MRTALAALAAAVALGAATAEARPLRVMTLDQCADQYALSLAPDAVLRLSPRADDPDSFLRAAALGRAQARPTLEAALSFQPDVVIRYWGGDPRLLRALQGRGARVLTIDDAADFAGVRANIRRIAAGLGRAEAGEALIARMDARLHIAAATAVGGRSALYLTPGGFTAGAGTLIDAILRAAGLRNLAGPGFAPVSVERIALEPPARFVLGFFDLHRTDRRGPGRHPVVRRAAEGRVAARLPGAMLTCPGWFAADAAVLSAQDR